ncbi:MAG: ABC transporter permease subunit [Candidatus Bathyarchaeia archaeon]
MGRPARGSRISLSRRVVPFFDSVSGSHSAKIATYAIGVLFFLVIVFVPPVFGILLGGSKIFEMLSHPDLLNRAGSAIAASFAIAVTVSLMDLAAGLPMAWFIVRSRSGWASTIDTLANIPFIVPTVALGYSVLTFWGGSQGIGSLLGSQFVLSPGWQMIVLLHFAFSYPVIVRVMVGALEGYKEVYETAARTLGASTFTAVRTVSLPLLKPALVAGFLLAFARSLSETGATVMVAGVFENGPVFIRNARAAGQQSPLLFVSLVLIVASSLFFIAIRIFAPKMRLPISTVWPRVEKRLSSTSATTSRNLLAFVVFVVFVIVPSLFVVLPGAGAVVDGTLKEAISAQGIWSNYWQSMGLSYLIALVATGLNIVAGLPMSVLIARKRSGKAISGILDTLINIPIVVPSIALGVSIGIFWGGATGISEFWLLVFAHASITYTYFVRSMIAAVESIPVEVEDVARTLGAKPLMIFRRLTIPLSKYALVAGAIMAFTRSIDETGATLAVAKKLTTAPVLMVNWVTGTVPASSHAIGLGLGILVLTSFASLLVLTVATRRT